MKKITIPLMALFLIVASIYGYNYFKLQSVMNDVLSNDHRNGGIKVRTTFENFINTDILLYNLTQVSNKKSMADVFRVFLQFSESVSSYDFDKIILAHNGKKKFLIDGEYFKKIGKEFDFQNPVYTTRTFPEHLNNLDGTPAYPGWTGGWLGVVGKQIEDFNDFHKQWYLNELAKTY